MSDTLATFLLANLDAVVVAIATLATVGFAINLGISTIAPTAWRLMKEEDELSIIIDRTKRIISKFAKTRYIYAYLINSVVYMASAVLLLSYFLSQDTDILVSSLIVSTVSVALTILISSVLIIKAAMFSQGDIDKTKRGVSFMFDSLSIKCSHCGGMNSLTTRICKTCGKPTGVVDATPPQGQSGTNNGQTSSRL